MTPFCEFPFTYLFVGEHRYSTCCPAWLDDAALIPANEGRAIIDPAGVWNHARLVKLRRSVLDGSYRHCRNCVRWVLGDIERKEPPGWCEPVMRAPPTRLVFDNDTTCTLRCWACRPGMRSPPDAGVRAMQAAMLEAWLPTLSKLSTLHSGDPFASPMHREMLLGLDGAKYPNLRIELFTNATLLPRWWPELRRLHGSTYRFMVSIDAGSKAVYERVRRGGRWEDLLAGLDVIREFRQQRPDVQLWTNMTVYDWNFRDIPAFVRLSQWYAADRVELKLLRQWWMPDAEYQARAVHRPEHPEHGEFLRVLEDPALALPHVDAAQVMPAGRKMLERVH